MLSYEILKNDFSFLVKIYGLDKIYKIKKKAAGHLAMG